MSKIVINTEMLDSKIEQLIVEKEKIDDALQKFKNDSLHTVDYWQGETGEMVSDNLNKYTSNFDGISNKLDLYIRFLKAVSLAYQDEEKIINDEIETNKTFSI